MVVGMAPLGERGMLKFGCVLLIRGDLAYFGNVIINQQFGGTANPLCALAALLGLISIGTATEALGPERQ